MQPEIVSLKDNLENLGKSTAEMFAVLKVLSQKKFWREGYRLPGTEGAWVWVGPGRPWEIAEMGMRQYKKVRRT